MRYDLGTIGLVGLLTLLSGPIGAAAVLLGITPSNLTALKLLLEDMPEDVATQLCNAFSHDRADETDDDLWKSPGDGLAVSPDDIKDFWDAPESPTGHAWHGLYGHSKRRCGSPRGASNHKRVHRLDRSNGPAYVFGTETYRGLPVEGAQVRYGCATTKTTKNANRLPVYQLELSAGRYEAVAIAYWPTTDEMLMSRHIVEVASGDQSGSIEIEVGGPT